jgi:hypothetical protein
MLLYFTKKPTVQQPSNSKSKDKVVPASVMDLAKNICLGEKKGTPRNLTLGTTWRCVVSLKPRIGIIGKEALWDPEPA